MARKEIRTASILKEPREDINKNFEELYDLVGAIIVDPPDNDLTKVPYTGATTDVDLGTNGLSADFVQLNTDTSPRTAAGGLLQWNSTDGTVDLGMSGGDVVMQLGQEMFIKVINKSGAPILNASAVYLDGRQGTRPKIKLAKGDVLATSKCIGITTQEIADNAEGFVTTVGYVRGVKTNYAGWAEGDELWLSKATAGSLTKTEPTAPHYSPSIGTVGIVHATLGSIFINIRNARQLDDLSDVNGTALSATGQIPVWNNTDKYFDFTSNISDYVPYTGATTDVNLGTHSLTTPSLKASTVDIEVDCGTNKTIKLVQTVWEDLRFPATLAKQGSNSKPDFDFTEVGLLFPRNDTDEIAYLLAQMPHAYKLGTNIYPHIHFVQSGANVPVFKLAYRWNKNGSAVTSFTTITTSSLVYTYVSGSILQIAIFPAISGAGIDSVSSVLDLKLYREDNVVVGDVLVKDFDIHYEIDTMGSRTILAK